MQYTTKFTNAFREQMKQMLILFFEEKVPHKLFLQNADDWDIPLPAENLKSEVLELDIKDAVFDHCFEKDGIVTLAIMIDTTKYTKELDMKDLIGIFDPRGSPILYKPFKETTLPKKDSYKVLYDKSKGLLRCLIDDTVMVI